MKYNRFILVALLLSASTLTMTGCFGTSKVAAPNNPVESAPPAAPASVSMVTENATGRDYLDWTPSASSDVASYQVFRFADSGTSNGELVATVSSDVNNMVLPLVGSSVTEYYRVRAVNSNDVASAYSPNCSADRTPFVNPGASDDPIQGRGKEEMN